MFAYRTPGVYFEWLDRLRTITRVRTDIAGFVGIATRGPLHQAIKVDSWAQYTGTFGDMSAPGFLAYAARGFFDNSGLVCWIVRITAPHASCSATFTLCA